MPETGAGCWAYGDGAEVEIGGVGACGLGDVA